MTAPPAAASRLRRRVALPLFAGFAAAAFTLITVSSPYAQVDSAYAAIRAESAAAAPTQELAVHSGVVADGVALDGYSFTEKPKPVPVVLPAVAGAITAPAAGRPDPGSAKAIAYEMLAARGWGDDQYSCLVSLWNKESGWNTFAMNKSSGAYGIPQSLPGNKMASAGADWQTNPATQITWGLGYIGGRYGTPCGAWAKSQSVGWY